WTELFNHLESTLPTGVMLTSVRPQIDKEELRIELTVLGREVEQIDDFIEKLEATGAFTGVLASEEAVGKEGDLEARIEARYTPAAHKARADDAAPSSAPAAGNAPAARHAPAAPAQGAS